jgi:putative ABC transport system permease protein
VTPFRLALLSLARRRLPTAIALVAIALPVAAGGILLRLYELSQSRFARMDLSFDAVVGGKGDELDLLLSALGGEGDELPAPFTGNLYDTIRDRHVASAQSDNPQRILFLRSAVPIALFARYRGSRVIGTDSAYWQRPAPEASPVLTAGHPPAAAGDVAVSEPFAAAHGLKLGDQLQADPWISPVPARNAALPPVPLTVVGLTRPTGRFWDQVLVADLATARRTFKELTPAELHPVWQERVLHYMLINCQPGGYPPLADLVNNATIAQAISVPAEVQRLKRLTGEGETLGLIITVMILALGGLAVAGIMLTRFDAMVGQLAVLRAIGYGLSELTLWLLTEGLLLGAAAAAVGAALDGALFPWFRRLSQGVMPLDGVSSPPLSGSLPVWTAAIAATILAAAIPLLRLYRHDVHRTLRTQ